MGVGCYFGRRCVAGEDADERVEVLVEYATFAAQEVLGLDAMRECCGLGGVM